MIDLPGPLIHPPVLKEDMPVGHSSARQSLPAAYEGSSKSEGHLGEADPFAEFTEWAGDIDAVDDADL